MEFFFCVIGMVLVIEGLPYFGFPEKMKELMTLLRGALAARGRVLIKFNIHMDDLESVMEIVPAAKSPTVARLYGSDYYAVESVVSKSGINHLIPQLKARGAEDILELPILKIVD